jgi:hypothetical protein
MEIGFTHTVKRIPFDSMEDANKVLSEIESLIGKDPYSLNDKSQQSFKIKSPVGDSVINTGAVTNISIVDYSLYTEQQAVKDFNKHEFNISERYIKSMVDAELEKYIVQK